MSENFRQNRPQSITEILNLTREEIKEKSESTAQWLIQEGIDPAHVPIVNLHPQNKTNLQKFLVSKLIDEIEYKESFRCFFWIKPQTIGGQIVKDSEWEYITHLVENQIPKGQIKRYARLVWGKCEDLEDYWIWLMLAPWEKRAKALKEFYE